MNVKHLAYTIDESGDRFAYYETLWKQVACALLVEHCSPRETPLTLLDYGCGRGEMLKIGREAGFEVFGCDPDPKCVELASRIGEARMVAPGNPLDSFEPRSFDAVSCFHVLEHVDCPIDVLRGLGQIARRYVVLAVPNLRNLRYMTTRKIDLAVVNEGHLQSWDHWHLKNLAEKHCGLELVAWGFDATILSGFSQVVAGVLGQKAAIAVETGLFKKLFPFHGLSIIGLFRPVDDGRPD